MQKKNEQPLSNDPMFASRLAQIEIDLQNLEITNLRTLASVENGEAPGAESSIIKILGSEIEQDIDNLTRKSLGKRAFVNEPDALSTGYNGAEVFPKAAAYASGKYFNHRKKINICRVKRNPKKYNFKINAQFIGKRN